MEKLNRCVNFLFSNFKNSNFDFKKLLDDIPKIPYISDNAELFPGMEDYEVALEILGSYIIQINELKKKNLMLIIWRKIKNFLKDIAKHSLLIRMC